MRGRWSGDEISRTKLQAAAEAWTLGWLMTHGTCGPEHQGEDEVQRLSSAAGPELHLFHMSSAAITTPPNKQVLWAMGGEMNTAPATSDMEAEVCRVALCHMLPYQFGFLLVRWQTVWICIGSWAKQLRFELKKCTSCFLKVLIFD